MPCAQNSCGSNSFEFEPHFDVVLPRGWGNLFVEVERIGNVWSFEDVNEFLFLFELMGGLSIFLKYDFDPREY